MSKILPAVKSVLADIAALRNKQLAAVVAGAVVAIAVPLAASVFGVKLSVTADEVAGGLALIGTIAAAIEANAAKKPTPAPTPAPVPPQK